MKFADIKIGETYEVNFIDTNKVKDKSYKGPALCIKTFNRAKTIAFAISNYTILILHEESVLKVSENKKRISKIFLTALLKKLESDV